MKTIKKRDELLTAGGMHREFQGCLYSFGTAVREMCSRRRGNRNDLFEFLAELRHVAIVIVSSTHMDQPRALLLNRTHNFRVTMSRGANGDARIAVEKDVAVNVFNPDALSTFRHQFEVRSRIRGGDVPSIGFDDFFSFRTR